MNKDNPTIAINTTDYRLQTTDIARPKNMTAPPPNAYSITALQIADPTKFRENVRAKLAARFTASDFEPSAAQNTALNLERGIYNYTLQESDAKNIVKKWENGYFVQIYADRLRTVCINLANPSVIQRIASKQIKAHELAFMTHQDMHPEKWAALIKAKQTRDKHKYETKVEASTDNFTCPNSKCRSTKCTYYQLQTRSADEPMTTFVTCIDCGKRWKC